MNPKFIMQLNELKPATRQEVKAALAKKRSQQDGVVAFEGDLLPSLYNMLIHRKVAAKG